MAQDKMASLGSPEDVLYSLLGVALSPPTLASAQTPKQAAQTLQTMNLDA